MSGHGGPQSPKFGLELMADHTPCAGACGVCEAFGELTPERLARLGAEVRRDMATQGGHYRRTDRLERAS